MVLARYVLKTMLRRPSKALGQLMLPLALLLFLSFLGGSLQMLDIKEGAALDSVQVPVVLSDLPGNNLSHLGMSEEALKPLLPGGALHAYVKDPCFARQAYYTLGADDNAEPALLAGVSALQGSYAHLLISAPLAVSFAPGQNAALLRGGRALLLVEERLLQQGFAFGDQLSLRLSQASYLQPFATQDFIIAGSFPHSVEGLMLCPYETLRRLMKGQDHDEGLSAASFTLRDNRRLDAFRQDALKHFEPVNYLAHPRPGRYALSIHDDELQGALQAIRQSRSTLGILHPLLLGLSAALGLLAGMLQVHGRRQELMLLRLQGLCKGRALALLLMETVGLAVVALLLSLLLTGLLGKRLPFLLPMPTGRQAAILLAALVLGHALAAMLWLSGPLLTKSKEVL